MSQRPLRVLHVIDGLGGGGSERWVWELVRLSDSNRVRHRVVAIHPDLGRFVYADRLREAGAFGRKSLNSRAKSVARLNGNAAGPRKAGGPATWFSGRTRVALRGVWLCGIVFPLATARVIAEYVRFAPDLIHAHTFHGLVAGLLLKRGTGRPLVHSVPSFFRHIVLNGYGWLPRLYAGRHSRIDRFITNYPRELFELGVPPEKVLVVRGMADFTALASVADQRASLRRMFRAQIGMADNDSLAITVGRLDSDKGYEFGLRALPAILEVHAGFRWVILGEGPLRVSLEQLASELGVAHRVHFMGFVENPVPWYLAADIYMRTHVLEGDNLSSVHAMAAALPVAGFDTGSEAELISLVGHGELAENRNPSRLAGVVTHLLARPDRHELGQRGRTYASVHLSSEAVIRSCEELYEDVVGSSLARPRSQRPWSQENAR